MATIYAKTGSQYIFATRSWNDPDTWDGGIVPTASDTVIIAGGCMGSTSYPGFQSPNYRAGAWRQNYGMNYWKGKTSLPIYGGTGSIEDSGSVFGYTSTVRIS